MIRELPSTRAWVELVISMLVSGHSVTFFGGQERDLHLGWDLIQYELQLLRIEPTVKNKRHIQLKNGAYVVFMPLRITGAACLHTPVVVFKNPKLGDPRAYQEARYVASPFPDGSQSIIMEC